MYADIFHPSHGINNADVMIKMMKKWNTKNENVAGSSNFNEYICVYYPNELLCFILQMGIEVVHPLKKFLASLTKAL